ncbi:unnamed protein product, partial [Phaeothamnion confervicola]
FDGFAPQPSDVEDRYGDREAPPDFDRDSGDDGAPISSSPSAGGAPPPAGDSASGSGGGGDASAAADNLGGSAGRPFPLPLCAAVAVFNGMQGGLIGAFVGGATGLAKAASHGVRGADLRLHARGGAVSYGASFAGFLATFEGTKCVSSALRGGKRDVLNTAIAGFASGAVAAVARRQVRHAVPQGVAVAVGAVALEVFFNIGSGSSR